MQAIHVKFLGPTNYRGSRYKATCQAKSITVSADYALNCDDNARIVAKQLQDEMQWDGQMQGGTLPDGTWAFVFVPEVEVCDSCEAKLGADALRFPDAGEQYCSEECHNDSLLVNARREYE